MVLAIILYVDPLCFLFTTKIRMSFTLLISLQLNSYLGSVLNAYENLLLTISQNSFNIKLQKN